MKEYGGISNTLNKYQFGELQKFFENSSGFNNYRGLDFEKNTLDISVHKSYYVDPRDDLSNLRFTIKNIVNIKKFCNDNFIPKIVK